MLWNLQAISFLVENGSQSWKSHGEQQCKGNLLWNNRGSPLCAQLGPACKLLWLELLGWHWRVQTQFISGIEWSKEGVTQKSHTVGTQHHQANYQTWALWPWVAYIICLKSRSLWHLCQFPKAKPRTMSCEWNSSNWAFAICPGLC